MRLSEEQVKQGIRHDDRQVRFAALEYFAQSFSRDPSIMPLVIEAFERFGRNDAFPFVHPIAELAQTPETITRAINEIQILKGKTQANRELQEDLGHLLCKADPELVLPHEVKILDALAFDDELRQSFSRLVAIHAWDEEACWRELEAFGEASKNKEYAEQAGYDDALQIAQSLARRGERHADRMMALLAEKIDEFENNPMRWLEPLAVYLAGEMRYEPAVPLIIGKLHEVGEVLGEECLDALVKIGTDSVIRGVGEAFPSASWHFRLYGSGVFGRIHSDLAVETCSKLLEDEETDDIRFHLATSLTDQFSTEGNELARQVVLDESGDPFDLKETLLASCTLLGQDLPELAKWRQEIDRAKQRCKNWGRAGSQLALDMPEADTSPYFDDDKEPPLAAPLHSKKGPGRNDPCPCGSGKKYKQCCMRKQSVL